MNISIKKVPFQGYGGRTTDNGIYFAVALDFLYEGGIRFYDAKTKELAETVIFSDDYSMGNVFCVLINGIDPQKYVYRYYSDKNEFIDPYSIKIAGNEIYGKLCSEEDLFSVIDISGVSDILSKDVNPRIPFEDSIIYLTHVRGATMLDKSIKHKGTFLGLSEKIPYFLNLGITALMIMPSYEFIECKKDSSKLVYKDYRSDSEKNPKVNFWGFEEGYYFSPKSSYSSSNNSCEEFAMLVKECHKNNIELIMMMYFTENVPGDIVVESLRYYVERFHVDGFRIMGTGIDVNRISEDPFLKKSKLFFENIDANRFWNEKNVRFKNIGLYTNIFIDNARSYLKGDEDKVSYISFAVRENNKIYSQVRYISDYYGFTLNDLVSYNIKHNENNGEDNTDGSDYNYSWNCGIEGPTRKSSVNKLRMQQAMNGMLISLLCQGTPQIRGGDECLNSCLGNNNPWCQDNEVGWVSYSNSKSSRLFEEFTRNLISFRKRHCILHQPGELKLFDYMSCRLPDISFHGEEAYRINQTPVSREFAILYAGDYAKQYKKQAEDSIYIVFNMHWEERKFSLPVNIKGYEWYLLFSSDGSTDISFDEDKSSLFMEADYIAKGRSITIFLLRKI